MSTQAFPASPALVRVAVLLLLAGLSACSSAPPPSPPPTPVDTTTPAQRLAAVEAAAGIADTELDVQPLRDPEVQDLRDAATRARAGNDLGAAARSLERALKITPEDPTLWQERAEVALLQAQYAEAETFARRAIDLGSKVGPICRRHWATIEQSRLARGQVENAASAHAQLEGCTVRGIERF